MSDLDKRIAELLREEEDALVADWEANEPGYFSQAMGLFKGRTGWPSMVLFVTQAVMFIAGVWMALKFYAADNVLEALHWGLPAAVLVLGALVSKLALWPQMHINRVLRELKLIEYQLARKD
ncbi:DUF6768 family protein [Sphingomicrobium aestuariivivum]|uniref:DUF6768 family protein n=1 Tax=Sphingomicrobium aestuariivivum TaxID=1582356 RepID=UPI001FD6ABD9|nr:DUF6768 family protein [Sphingomicrobium aestuariivivum]MCJ8191843.1 hypothetical protein [Sphingomicrobium aestuariivivum]